MTTVLVTGGAGFIGSHVCDSLLEGGVRVVCVDDFSDYYNPGFKRENVAGALGNPDFILHEADVRDADVMHGIFEKEKPDKIIHLAARAGVRASIQQPRLYEDVNARGTLVLLELARETEAGQFVFGSSSSVYGVNPKVPFHEDDLLENIISPYAASKAAAESYCRVYSHLYDLQVTCLRFFTVYGPRGRPDMAPYKFTRLIDEGRPIDVYGDGSSRRDYTYVDDIVSGVLAALDKPFSFEIFNLGESRTVGLREFISVIEEELGKKAIITQKPMQPGDVPVTCADVTKAGKLLGYRPGVPIEEGMHEFVEWYKANRRGLK